MSGFPLPHVDGVRHDYVTVDGVRLHYAEAGEGDPLVLLHGWPQHWWMWRHQIGPLAAHFRVICPDFRGLGWSDITPTGYSLPRQTADFLGLFDELGLERVHLVGHDWGLAVGTWMCLHHADRLERFVGMGGPHVWIASGLAPRAYLNPWHIVVLGSPLGEFAVNRLRLHLRALRTWRHLGEFTPQETEIYRASFRRPGAARATAQRYRHLLGDFYWFLRHYRRLYISVPTLHLVGENDPIIAIHANRYLETHADDYVYEVVPGAGHFFPEERPDWVTARLLEFFGRGIDAATAPAREPAST